MGAGRPLTEVDVITVVMMVRMIVVMVVVTGMFMRRAVAFHLHFVTTATANRTHIGTSRKLTIGPCIAA